MVINLFPSSVFAYVKPCVWADVCLGFLLHLLLLLYGHRLASDPLWCFPAEGTMIAASCSVWSVTRQNRLPSSKSLFVSLPLTSLSLHTTSICIFIATCLPSLLSDQVLLRSWNADFWQQTHSVQEIKSIYLSIPWERTSRRLFEYVAQKAPELEVCVWCLRASVFSENQNGISVGLRSAEC